MNLSKISCGFSGLVSIYRLMKLFIVAWLVWRTAFSARSKVHNFVFRKLLLKNKVDASKLTVDLASYSFYVNNFIAGVSLSPRFWLFFPRFVSCWSLVTFIN